MISVHVFCKHGGGPFASLSDAYHSSRASDLRVKVNVISLFRFLCASLNLTFDLFSGILVLLKA